MELPKAVAENLRFLTIEICNQINRASVYITSTEVQVATDALDKYDYIINLSTVVQNHCVDEIARTSKKSAIVAMGCVFNMAACFNRMGSAAVRLVHYRRDRAEVVSASEKQFISGCSVLVDAIKLVDTRLMTERGSLGLTVCDRADTLLNDLRNVKLQPDYSSREHQDSLVEPIVEPRVESVEQSSYLTFVIEQLAYELLVLGEAILSYEHAEFLTVRQLRALNNALPAVANETFAGGIGGVAVEKIAETRSGCFISGVAENKTYQPPFDAKEGVVGDEGEVSAPGRNDEVASSSSDIENNTTTSTTDSEEKPEYLAIFKEGKKEKLKVEKKQFEAWNALFPGMAPKVIAYKKQGKTAALLVEYIKGKTFEQLLFAANAEALRVAVNTICQTLDNIWTTARQEESKPAGFMKQLDKRLRAVTRIHPEYDSQALQIGAQEIPGLRQLIKRCRTLEDGIKPKFSVFTHGDFNIDNVIFDSRDGRPRFIDLHRSKYTDYLQDISVFMVSNFRVQVVDLATRQNISTVMQSLYQFACEFGEKQQDNAVQARLALGLARSFITSTRFVLDDGFSNEMFYRGRYLMERIVDTPADQLVDFVLPQEVLRG